MSNWKNKLNISDLKQQYEDEKLTVAQLCNEVGQRIAKHPLSQTDEEFKFYSVEFCVLSENNPTREDFDNLMEKFYDWADDHRLWIQTEIQD